MAIRMIIQRGVERRDSGLQVHSRVTHQSASAVSGRPDLAVKVPLRTEVMATWTASHMGGTRNPTG